METIDRPLVPLKYENAKKGGAKPRLGQDNERFEWILKARALREWMGDSVITENGRAGGTPTIVFHGTRAVFTDFNVSERGTFGRGVYLTSDRGAADIFGGEIDETVVMELHIKMERPYRHRIREGESLDCWGEGLVLDIFEEVEARRLIEAALWGDGSFGSELTEQLQSMGHDGIIATFSDGAQELVVFSADQVKLASEWAFMAPIPSMEPSSFAGPEHQGIDLVGPPGHPGAAPGATGGIGDFDDWFRGSHVVDRGGRPQVLFHGTSGAFDQFSEDKVGSRHVDVEAGTAFFFTDDPKTASWYAESSNTADGGGGNVIPVYLSLRNPYDVDFQETGIETLAESIEEAKALGHDSLIARNYDDGGVSTHYIAFHPEQIRPALCDPFRHVRAAKPAAAVHPGDSVRSTRRRRP